MLAQVSQQYCLDYPIETDNAYNKILNRMQTDGQSMKVHTRRRRIILGFGRHPGSCLWKLTCALNEKSDYCVVH